MNTQRNQKGFTLIELIVVVAIIGIIGAALVPQFSTMTIRARMSTDVSTIKAAQDQVELYYVDEGKWPEGTDNPSDVISSLVAASLLDSRYLKDNTDQELIMQSPDASVGWDDDAHKLYVSVKEDDLSKYNKSQDIAQKWIRCN